MRRIITFLIIGLSSLHPLLLQAQVLHEIGITAGPAIITTDYGERGDFRNFYRNSGFGIGLQHYMNFTFTGNQNKSTLAKDFLRVRSDFNYFNANLNHFGPISYQNNPRGEMLRAMHGNTQIIEAGSQLEWHFTQIREYLIFTKRFSPYATAGVHLVYYMPDAYSDLGSFEEPGVLFPSFRDGLKLENGFTYSIVFGGGTRYRLGRDSDLVAELKWHYYGSDYIEGLNVQGPQNRSNDWLIWLNIGYIHYLNF